MSPNSTSPQRDITQLREWLRGVEVSLRARSRHPHHLPGGPQQGTSRHVPSSGLRYRGEQAGLAPERAQRFIEALGVDHHRAVRPGECLSPAGRIWLRSTSTVRTVICSGSSKWPGGGVRLFHRDDEDVGSRWHRGARHDADRVAGWAVDARGASGNIAAHRQHPGVCASHVGRVHREAIHRGVIEDRIGQGARTSPASTCP